MFRCLILLVLMVSMIGSAAADWSEEMRVTDDSAVSATEAGGGYNVAVDDQEYFMVWTDDRDGNNEIYFRHQIGSWGLTENISNDPGNSCDPSIGIREDGEVWVVWEDDRTGHPEIYFRQYDPVGYWYTAICLTEDEFSSRCPAIDRNGSHLVWEETRDGNSEIYLRRSLSSDYFWGDEIRVSNDAAMSTNPTVSSIDLGEIFTLVAWEDLRDGNWQIYSRYADYNGWQPEIRTSLGTTGEAHNPSVAIDFAGGCIIEAYGVIAWDDSRHGPGQIYQRSIYGGDGLGYEIRLCEAATGQSNPSVAISWILGEGIFGPQGWPHPRLVWQAWDPLDLSWRVAYHDTYSHSPGQIEWLSSSEGNAAHPSIASWSGYLGMWVNSPVVWTDTRHGNDEIYLRLNEEEYTGVDQIVLPDRLVLEQNQPNPFNPLTAFAITLPVASSLEVTVHDLQGHLIRTIFTGRGEVGRTGFVWDGTNNDGQAMPSGVYLLRARSGSDIQQQKATLIR